MKAHHENRASEPVQDPRARTGFTTRFAPLALSLALTACASAPDGGGGHSLGSAYAETGRLAADVAWLADDAREGRRAGTAGERAAGEDERRGQRAIALSAARPDDLDGQVGEHRDLDAGRRGARPGGRDRRQDAADVGSKVRWTEFDLSDNSIRDHVANGMRLTHLAIVYDNILSCVVDENGVLTKVRFLGMDDDGADDTNELGRQDAEFVLMTGTLRRMLADFRKLLGGTAD